MTCKVDTSASAANMMRSPRGVKLQRDRLVWRGLGVLIRGSVAFGAWQMIAPRGVQAAGGAGRMLLHDKLGHDEPGAAGRSLLQCQHSDCNVTAQPGFFGPASAPFVPFPPESGSRLLAPPPPPKIIPNADPSPTSTAPPVSSPPPPPALSPPPAVPVASPPPPPASSPPPAVFVASPPPHSPKIALSPYSAAAPIAPVQAPAAARAPEAALSPKASAQYLPVPAAGPTGTPALAPANSPAAAHSSCVDISTNGDFLASNCSTHAQRRARSVSLNNVNITLGDNSTLVINVIESDEKSQSCAADVNTHN